MYVKSSALVGHIYSARALYNRLIILDRERLRVAVVGLGKMGLLHAGILNVLPNVHLTALCDKSAVIRRFFGKVFRGIKMVDGVEKLLDLDLDAVYVTTPIPSHFSIASAIYVEEIARNLFVEKTLSSSYDESKELCGLASRFGGTNMVGYTRRFSVTYRKAKDLLAQHAIGEVISFSAYAYSSDFLGDKKDIKAGTSRGGVLRDLGCHAIDLALWFFGELQVGSVKLTSIADDNSEDSAYFKVKNSNGVQGEFSISWREPGYRMPEIALLIRGSKGIIEVNDDKVKLKMLDGKSFIWYRHDLNDNVDFWLGGPEYFRENKSFVDSMIEGRSAEPSFLTASRVDHIIDEVKRMVNRNG